MAGMVTPAKVTLTVTRGPIQGTTFEFEEHDTFIFGRSPDCHARLPPDDTRASRHHFLLEVNPPEARLRDLGSLNGTHVNDVKHGGRAVGESAEEAAGRRFPEVDLKDGDVVRVGETVFEVQVEVAARCIVCGRLIPDNAHAYYQAGDACCGPFCPRCLEKPGKGAKPPRKVEPLRCRECGKDASAEDGGGRRGDYVCAACRASADPAALLLKMIVQRARQRGESGPGDVPGYGMGKILGKGGMGAVYLARRLRDGAQVAVKVMLSKVAVDEHAREAFQREIEVTKSIRHPHCVEFFDHGSAGSGFYFVMEFCPGGSVDALMARQGGKLGLKLAGAIVLEALDGLAYAHDHGFVHRDLKPQNVLLMDPGGRGVKVSDFGLAKNFQKAGFSGMTATGSAAGTYPFMAREQLTNFKFVKPVSDVWSMGATLYHMLTGAFPRDFRRGQDPMEVILSGGVVPIRKRDAGIPKGVAGVVDRSVADRASDRYQTAGEFRKELARAL